MTKQITIKLNAEKFKQVFKELNEFSDQIIGSDSELAAFCIFYTHRVVREKLSNGKTRFQTFLEMRNMDEHAARMEMIRKFKEFQKTGKLSH